jgi:PadR family transcriptional regulator, regulatory protein PadR
MLILKALARMGPMHGYRIALHILQTTGEVLQVEDGSLVSGPRAYAPQRLGGRRAASVQKEKARRFYKLMPLRREQLVAEVAALARVVTRLQLSSRRRDEGVSR